MSNPKLKVIPLRVCVLLKEQFGGVWHYVRQPAPAKWACDDGRIVYARRVKTYAEADGTRTILPKGVTKRAYFLYAKNDSYGSQIYL